MAYRAVTISEFEAYERRRSRRKPEPPISFRVFAFASIIPVGVWMLYSHLTTPWIDTVSVGPMPVFASPAAPKVNFSSAVHAVPKAEITAQARIALKTALEAASNVQSSIHVASKTPARTQAVEAQSQSSQPAVTVTFQTTMFDPTLSDPMPSTFSENTAFGPKTEWNKMASAEALKEDSVASLPAASTSQVAQLAPVAPAPRAPDTRLAPPALPPRSQIALVTKAATQPAITRGKPALPKIFDPEQSDGPVLAYAPADAGVDARGNASPAQQNIYDGFTAVYDITGKIVHMPDGSKLEAHSGLGQFRDDPRHVEKRMRGATPPHTYDLKLRESLFHGVRAIRLTPVGGESAIFNRNGLLAHTYMLGPNGDSNGCVSFKNYDAFLQAFLNKKVKRLIVVDRLRADPPSGPAVAKRSVTASAS